MLNLDLSFTITAIIALISLISPILTTIINNFHDSKIRELELKNRIYEQTVIYKRDIILSYLSSVGKCISYCETTDLKDYGFYYAKSIALITNDNTIELMKKLNQEIVDHSWDSASKIFHTLIPYIKNEIINSH